MNNVITRFAPSPTGFLHIGGARTALFNYLYAKHHGGKYLVRIEDTDKERSTPEACQAIIDGLGWLGLGGDQDIIYQSHNLQKHTEIAHKLLQEGKAYQCYCTPEELQDMREKAKVSGQSFIGYDRRCRDLPPKPNAKAAIRIKAPLGEDGTASPSRIDDLVQGSVEVPANTLDDFVILRQDGTPTYMFSVVVDDYNMGITHIIRGDDHLMNAHRQKIIFDACGWQCPKFAHIPLIHGSDGKKLSKRHGALGVDEYRNMGYLPEALLNYILRLGWGHGDDEVFSIEQAIKLFDVANVSKGASQFDFDKLDNLNSHYISDTENEKLAMQINELKPEWNDNEKQRILKNSIGFLKKGRKNLNELAEVIMPYVEICEPQDNDAEFIDFLDKAKTELEACEWQADSLKTLLKSFEEKYSLKTKDVMQALRFGLLGTKSHPGGITDILMALDKQESLHRIERKLKNE